MTKSPLAHHWTHHPGVDFLNHGSFGGAPRVVLEAQAKARAEMESELIRYLAPERELEGKLDAVRTRLAAFMGCQFEDLAFVRNVTDGVNAVLRSFPFVKGDEMVVTNHGYNACSNAARFVMDRAYGVAPGEAARGGNSPGVVVADVPFPIASPSDVLDALDAAYTDRTKLLLVDHITSPTALVMPIQEIVQRAQARGIRVLVDAAHAAGMVKMDLDGIGADYTSGNLHKWLSAPKTSGYLHVKPEHQASVRPTVISHAANTARPGRSRYLAEFDWTGTFDPTPLLAVPTAIDFFEGVLPGGIESVYAANRALALEGRAILAKRLGIEAPAPDEMIGSIATLPLPDGPKPAMGQPDHLAQVLFRDHSIEVPIVHWPAAGRRWIRISAMLYNTANQYERLADALEKELRAAS